MILQNLLEHYIISTGKLLVIQFGNISGILPQQYIFLFLVLNKDIQKNEELNSCDQENFSASPLNLGPLFNMNSLQSPGGPWQ